VLEQKERELNKQQKTSLLAIGHFKIYESAWSVGAELISVRDSFILEILLLAELTNKFRTVYGTGRIITVFTGTSHLIPFCARLIQSSYQVIPRIRPRLCITSQNMMPYRVVIVC
jgi:hypothetical protein